MTYLITLATINQISDAIDAVSILDPRLYKFRHLRAELAFGLRSCQSDINARHLSKLHRSMARGAIQVLRALIMGIKTPEHRRLSVAHKMEAVRTIKYHVEHTTETFK